MRVVRRSVAPSLSSRLNKEISSLLAEFWWASFFKDSISATRPIRKNWLRVTPFIKRGTTAFSISWRWAQDSVTHPIMSPPPILGQKIAPHGPSAEIRWPSLKKMVLANRKRGASQHSTTQQSAAWYETSVSCFVPKKAGKAISGEVPVTVADLDQSFPAMPSPPLTKRPVFCMLATLRMRLPKPTTRHFFDEPLNTKKVQKGASTWTLCMNWTSLWGK